MLVHSRKSLPLNRNVRRESPFGTRLNHRDEDHVPSVEREREIRQILKANFTRSEGEADCGA